MFAWGASRLAGLAVRVMGGSSHDIDAARVTVGAALSLVDPVGGAIALAHSGVSAAARNGDPAAKLANAALSLGSIVAGGADLPDPDQLSDA